MANELFGFNTTQKAELEKYINARIDAALETIDLTAANVSIVDAGDGFTATNVEDALAELKALHA